MILLLLLLASTSLQLLLLLLLLLLFKCNACKMMLCSVYSVNAASAHKSGAFHIHNDAWQRWWQLMVATTTTTATEPTWMLCVCVWVISVFHVSLVKCTNLCIKRVFSFFRILCMPMGCAIIQTDHVDPLRAFEVFGVYFAAAIIYNFLQQREQRSLDLCAKYTMGSNDAE